MLEVKEPSMQEDLMAAETEDQAAAAAVVQQTFESGVTA
jgi:hypothetical protein